MGSIPLLLSVLVGLVLGLVTWGTLQLHRRTGDGQPETRDGILLGLVALAAFALGAFLTYVLLGIGT